MRRISSLLIGIAFAAVPAGAAYAIWGLGTDSDGLRAAIKRLGFDPQIPPTVFGVPGSILHVSSNGKWTSTLCEAEPERVKQVMRESPSEWIVSHELTNASFRINAELTKTIHSKTDAKILQSVNYSLQNVKVLEVSLEDLGTIADELQKRPYCQKKVIELLAMGEYVCQVQRVLLASATYTVDNGGQSTGSINADVLHAAIQTNVEPTASHTGTLTVAGANLYYGMKFTPGCIAPYGYPPRRISTHWYEKVRDYLFDSNYAVASAKPRDHEGQMTKASIAQ
jgi:hypothetical protein